MSQEFAFRKLTNVPQLSLGERDRRWFNIRQEMALKDLDCLLIFSGAEGRDSANLRYVTNVGRAGVGLFPLQGEPIIFGELPHTCVYPMGSQTWISRFRAGTRPDE